MLTILLIFLLLSNALTSKSDKSILFSRLAMTGLIFVTFLAWSNLFVTPLEKGIGIYGGLFHVTTFTQTFSIFLLLISTLILSLNAFFPRKLSIDNVNILHSFSKVVYNKEILSNKNGEQFRIIEYPLIQVFIILGGLFLISTSDLISVFLSIELQSYGLYILSTLYRDSESATASGLTYFLLGGLSSCFILLGSALLYVNSGTTSLENIYVIASLSEVYSNSSLYMELQEVSSSYPLTEKGDFSLYLPHYLYLSLIIMSVGFLFKVSAAPFHFWSPDVYDGIPTIVTTFVAIVAKISIFAFFLELVYYTEYSIFGFSWKNILLLSSFFSLIIGSTLGLVQFRIKRLFAYSTISHVGFILLGLSITSTESIQAYIFYILQYSLSNLNAFVILIAIGFSMYNLVYKTNKQEGISLKEKNNSPIQLISQIRGYFHVNPYLAISLAITLFSFVGIPPLAGFFAKQMILSAALDSGYVFLALVAILTSVIGAVYYLNLIKEIFFYKTEQVENLSLSNIKSKLISQNFNSLNIRSENTSIKVTSPKKREEKRVSLSSSLASIISITTLLLILFIYTPELWFNLVSILALIIFKS